MSATVEELKKLKPGRIGFDEEGSLNRYSPTGPDGKGFDANITSPEDFQLALEEIFASLTKLRELQWNRDEVAFSSSIITQLEAYNTLDVLYVAFSACEEDFFIPPESLPSKGLPRPSEFPKYFKSSLFP